MALFLTSCVSADFAHIYYDGFWTHHRIYKTKESIVSDNLLDVKVDITNLPNKAQNLLFSNFEISDNFKPPLDIILYIKVTDKRNVVLREILSSRDVLYDSHDNAYKQLTVDEKDYLQCLFIQLSNTEILYSEDWMECEGNDTLR